MERLHFASHIQRGVLVVSILFTISPARLVLAAPLEPSNKIQSDTLFVGSSSNLNYRSEITTTNKQTDSPQLFTEYPKGLNLKIDAEFTEKRDRTPSPPPTRLYVTDDASATQIYNSLAIQNIKQVSYPNTYSDMVVQAIYGTGTNYLDRNRSEYFSGGNISSVSKVTDYYGSHDKKIRKEVIGSLGVALSTGAAGKPIPIITASDPLQERAGRDDFRVTNISSAAVGLDANVGQEGTSTGWRFRRWFVETLICSLNEALFAPPRSADARGRSSASTPMVPSRAEWMIGSEANAQIDMGTSDSKTYQAIARQDFVHTLVQESFINFGTVRGSRYQLFDPQASHVQQTGSGENSTVERWTGVSVLAPNIPGSAPSEILPSSAGMSLHRQIAASDHVKRTERLKDTSSRLEKQYPSIEGDGIMVIGDSDSDISITGYDTDALHVRGYVKFTAQPNDPASTPMIPYVLTHVPDVERAGLLVLNSFVKGKTTSPTDSEKLPGLYVSLAKQGGGISWYKLKYDIAHAEVLGDNNVRITHPSATNWQGDEFLQFAWNGAAQSNSFPILIDASVSDLDETITARFYNFSTQPQVKRLLIQDEVKGREKGQRLEKTDVSTSVNAVSGTSPTVYEVLFDLDPAGGSSCETCIYGGSNVPEPNSLIIYATDPNTGRTATLTVAF